LFDIEPAEAKVAVEMSQNFLEDLFLYDWNCCSFKWHYKLL